MLTALALVAPQIPAQADEADPTVADVADLKWSPTPDLVDLDNWRGPDNSYNAYNVVHFVAKKLPNRQPADTTSDDPLGEPDPTCNVDADNCDYNHQLEYLDWFETAYEEVLGDFGVTFRTYPFTSPGSTLGNFATNAGSAFNKFAIVPGAEHPEDFVIIGSHFDGVDGSPFAAWDSTAGTGVMLRTAKMLADYWKATGTRPSKTVIFAAWDAEEAGGVGSKWYVANNRPKDPDATMTAYLNHDPCGGHYPALYRGLPVSRNPLVESRGFIPMNVALHAPGGPADGKARMQQFNAAVPTWINQLFQHIDDTLPLSPAGPDIDVFVSKQEAEATGSAAEEQESVVKVTDKGLVFFTTDAEDFPNTLGIPTFNPYPDNVGPHALGPNDLGWSADGLAWYHSPLDNFEELVRYTSYDQTGLGYSKGLAMSWEFCSMFSAWIMLQRSQGALQVADGSVVAFFETPLPNRSGGKYVFDASGSYKYSDVASRTIAPVDDLIYTWDFGDGATGSGRVVEHDFATGIYPVRLTVTDRATGVSDQMQLQIGR